MKNTLFMIGLLSAAIVSCQAVSETPTVYQPKLYVTGAYVYSQETEFMRIWDTLVISATPFSGKYRIDRSTSYQGVKEDELLPPVRVKQRWIGVFDQGRTALLIRGREETLFFKPELLTGVFLGKNAYLKIEK